MPRRSRTAGLWAIRLADGSRSLLFQGWLRGPLKRLRSASRRLPALLLARVDGKSPVEYLTDEAQRDQVRAVAARLLLQPVDYLYQVAQAFEQQIQSP